MESECLWWWRKFLVISYIRMTSQELSPNDQSQLVKWKRLYFGRWLTAPHPKARIISTQIVDVDVETLTRAILQRSSEKRSSVVHWRLFGDKKTLAKHVLRCLQAFSVPLLEVSIENPLSIDLAIQSTIAGRNFSFIYFH